MDKRLWLAIAGLLMVFTPALVWADIQDRADSSKMASESRSAVSDDNFIIEEVKAVKTGNSAVKITLPPTVEPTTLAQRTSASTTTEPETESTEEEVTATTAEPTTETPTTTAEPTTEETVPTEATASGTPLYRCHGAVLTEDLQEYAYYRLCERGMEGYFPYFICQAYQESTFQTDQRTLNHGNWDCGLMQIRETYWGEFQRDSGIYGDILDPYVNISVSVWLLSGYWNAYGGNISETISHYMSGWGGEYMEQYVDDVLSHMNHLERIR